MHPVFYVSYLWLNVGPTLSLPLAPLPLDNVAAGKYEVKDILDSCICHSSPEYLVKCLGNPEFESKWEPASHLANAIDVLH